MKKFLVFIGSLIALFALVVLACTALQPWMDSWGASDAEISSSLPGESLVANPRVVYNRAVTIHAAPEQIYPWIVQLGAEKGGMYSFSWFETNILRCELINADSIHAEWQDLKVGDKVKMCPGAYGPPPYEVALIEPDHAIVMGHYENGNWVDAWYFVLEPRTDGTTRLILRSRDTKTGWMWDAMRPGEYIMVRGMLQGIKERAESTPVSAFPKETPGPEVFNPLNPSPTP